MKRFTATVLLLVLLLNACSAAPTWQEQYDLGVRYLSEGNYEEAIIAFTAAIEIDPKQPDAYVGRGDAYVGQADAAEDKPAKAELLEIALADYEQAISLGEPDVQEKYDAVQTALENLRIQINSQPQLQALYEYLASGDLETAKSLMRQDDYRAISASIVEGCLTYIGNDGSCLAVYPENYYYFGQWANNQRSGHGLWILAVSDTDSTFESEVYDGAWQGDLPNGEGSITIMKYQEKIQPDEGDTTSVRTETQGSFLNGLYHGTILETWYMDDGDILTWTPITAINGVYQPIQNVPEDIKVQEYYQENVSSGEYIVALAQENMHTDLWNDGSPTAVFGFEKK